MKDDAGGTEGEKGAILNDATLARLQLYVTHKGACIAVVITERIAQLPTLVARNGDGAVVKIYAGVDSLEGSIDGVALLITANDVITHLQGNDLLVVEHILNDDDATTGAVSYWFLPVSIFLLLGLTELADTNADAKLLATLVTLEYQ